MKQGFFSTGEYEFLDRFNCLGMDRIEAEGVA
jgi:hypothetical protein